MHNPGNEIHSGSETFWHKRRKLSSTQLLVGRTRRELQHHWDKSMHWCLRWVPQPNADEFAARTNLHSIWWSIPQQIAWSYLTTAWAWEIAHKNAKTERIHSTCEVCSMQSITCMTMNTCPSTFAIPHFLSNLIDHTIGAVINVYLKG